jgi:hypothetical protein
MMLNSQVSRREASMLIHDFSERAAECVKLAERARTEHDRELFITMARAWCGINEDVHDDDGRPARPH